MFIFTQRRSQNWPSFDLVHEWEDELANAIPNAELYFKKDITVFGKHILFMLERMTKFLVDQLFWKKQDVFYFEMQPKLTGNLLNFSNVSVCIIDFYLKKEELPAFYQAYSNVKHLYVSSREAYDFLMANHPQRRIEHMPLSLPDKYRLDKGKAFHKKFDLVLVGRQNPILMEYLHEYEKNHPINYVYRGELKDGHFPYYTNQGVFVGNVDDRADYFNLLKLAKTAFYSTPGIDGDEKRTNGFGQVTPRLLEQLACGCQVIARYRTNSDTAFYELDKVVYHVESYCDFERALTKAINTPVDLDRYEDYLKKHYTSEIARRYLL